MFCSFHPLADKTNNKHLRKLFFKVIRKSLYLIILVYRSSHSSCILIIQNVRETVGEEGADSRLALV